MRSRDAVAEDLGTVEIRGHLFAPKRAEAPSQERDVLAAANEEGLDYYKGANTKNMIYKVVLHNFQRSRLIFTGAW
jgi:hypothetical protein